MVFYSESLYITKGHCIEHVSESETPQTEAGLNSIVNEIPRLAQKHQHNTLELQ